MATEPVEAFRENLKRHCAERGSVPKIQAKAEVGKKYLYELMRGDKVPSIETAARIADAIGVSLASMLDKPTAE